MLIKYTNASQLVGNTPILELKNIQEDQKLQGKIFAKLECFNLAGSVKDRIAKAMIEDAEEKGRLKADSVIIEPTSGNTGIGIASLAAAKGYRAILVMPETMSIERRKLMKAYGAELILTEGSKGMKGAIEKVDQLLQDIPNAIKLNQFANKANPGVHYKTTGPEIWNDMEGKVDILVAGVGTGGTISGAGKYLKESNPNIKIVAVEPEASAVLSGNAPGPHKIQGIGPGFIPEVLDTNIYDEILKVKDEDALTAGRLIGKREGVLVGISSGAALFGAMELAKKEENKGKNIVVVFPDTGERYLSSVMFED